MRLVARGLLALSAVIALLRPSAAAAQGDALPPALLLPVWRVADTALSVWIQQPRAGARSDSIINAIRVSMEEWNAQKLPVRMRLSADSMTSGIRVIWIGQFDEEISGRTTAIDDGVGHLVSANMVLAHTHLDGRVLGSEELRILALHEFGHALGLEHSLDSMSVMAPRVRARNITPEDRVIALRLYSR